ncbi:glycosyltransferase family 4 protein [Hymenobacter sp. BT188]|uniref:glycosyltransferase family 4 protein n=1 Tax=Hymenobacter sp. BT188 TaxID=2763504 RepID=UPI0016513231|nr:glycosyltransferase family 1 protein [Hymenobacter sp. BT188]MBC6607542.1 glycosyltransferase family 4 protein [Hymenobacter sp. BT188]
MPPSSLHIAVNTRFLLPGDALEGIGRFTFETLSRMVRQHPEHTFHFLFDRPYDARYVFAANVIPHVLAPPARHPLLFVAWFEGAVAAWLRRHKPAVFLSTDGFTTLATAVPRVTVVHDLAFEHFPQDVSWLVRRYYHFFMPRFVRASAWVIAVSEATKQDLMQTYGLAADRIRVIYNAPGGNFAPQAAPEQAATRARFSQQQPYILFVGALQPRKNLVNLLRAFEAFKTRTGSATQLLIVGRQAWKAGPIFEVYQQMRHREAVRLTGRVSDAELVQLYAAARGCAYVPYFEGFGIPIVEAQASGCPVITSNVSSMPEVAGPEGALLVNPVDVADISNALEQLDTNPELRQRLIARGLENVQRFSWERSAEQLWSCLQEVIKG